MESKMYLIQYWVDDFDQSESRTIFATTDKKYAEAYANKFNSKLEKIKDFVYEFSENHPEVYNSYDVKWLDRFRLIDELICPCKIKEVELR